MASPLTLVLISTVLCTGGDTARNDVAPFTFSEASNTYQCSHNLSCSHYQNVFIWNVQNGYKQRKCQCDKDQHCCQYARNDCRQAISPDILQQATLECWDKRECRPLVTKPKDSCWKNGVEFQWPTYSRARYWCVPGDTVVDMTKQTSVSGDVVTARALPAGLSHSHTVTCSVQAVGGGRQIVFVSAVLSQEAPPLSTLSVGTETLGKQGRYYLDLDATTPFNISLQQPAHSRLHYAWVRMAESGNSSSGGREQLESDTEDTMLPGTAGPTTETVVGLAAGLAGLVVALAASWVIVFLVWRRRQRARGTGHGTQPDQGGRIVLAELTTARPDVTYEPLRTEGGYQRLALPGEVGAPPGDVISVGQDDFDDCDVVDVIDEDPNDVIFLEQEDCDDCDVVAVTDENPNDVISVGQEDYDDCDVVGVTDKDPNDISRVEREGQVVEESPYEVIEPYYVNLD